MKSPDQLVRVGQIVGAFGIKGQVKLLPLTDFAERFEVGRRLQANGEWLTIKSSLLHGTQTILTFEEVTDRTSAENLQWVYLDAVTEERPELDVDEYLSSDLVGLVVQTHLGDEIGSVKEILIRPAHDVIVVTLDEPKGDEKEVLIPAIKEFIKKVNIKSKTMTVKLIEGMLPE